MASGGMLSKRKWVQKDLETTTVLVASEAAIKLAAAETAFDHYVQLADGQVAVGGCSVPSGVNAQPVGHEEILRGARKRLEGAAEVGTAGVDFVVAIENGLVELQPGRFWDLAWVIVRRVEDGEESMAVTSGVEFPAADVQAARALPGGLASNTVGQVIAKRSGCDPQDPHSHVTRNMVGRKSALVQALMGAIATLPHEAPCKLRGIV